MFMLGALACLGAVLACLLCRRRASLGSAAAAGRGIPCRCPCPRCGRVSGSSKIFCECQAEREHPDARDARRVVSSEAHGTSFFDGTRGRGEERGTRDPSR